MVSVSLTLPVRWMPRQGPGKSTEGLRWGSPKCGVSSAQPVRGPCPPGCCVSAALFTSCLLCVLTPCDGLFVFVTSPAHQFHKTPEEQKSHRRGHSHPAL